MSGVGCCYLHIIMLRMASHNRGLIATRRLTIVFTSAPRLPLLHFLQVAKLFADSCSVCMCSFISPYKVDRDAVREKHEKDGLAFYEVYVKVPLEVAESRDPKGLYKKAREGKIPGVCTCTTITCSLRSRILAPCVIPGASGTPPLPDASLPNFGVSAAATAQGLRMTHQNQGHRLYIWP